MSKNVFKGIVAGILAGAVTVCSVPVIAKNIEAVMNSVNIKLNGELIASVDENYVLQNGSKVPYSILYEGTTYLPIRKLSEILDIDIDWDNDTRTVLVGSESASSSGTYDSWYGAPDFGKFYNIREINTTPTVYSVTHWYEVDKVGSTTEYVDELEACGFEKVTDGDVKPRFKVYKKDNIEVWLDLGLYTKLVYGVTVIDTTRPITGREITYSGNREDIPNFTSVFGYNSYSSDGYYYIDGEFDMWACIPDYLTLLEQEGFKVSSLDKSFYGKSVTLKKDRSTVFIKFDGSPKSSIPALVIDY